MASAARADNPVPRSHLLRLGAALLGYKAFLLALVFASAYLLRGIFSASNYQANFHWPPNEPPSMASLFKTWDAQHYLYLSQEGYNPESVSNNFYPLWPFLIRLGTGLCAGDPLVSGLVLANLLSLAALVLFYAYAGERHGPKAAERSLVLWLAYPGALFLSFPFSESLFLLLCLGLFLALWRRHLAWAAACSFLLALSRPEGVLAALPYWYALWRSHPGPGRHRGTDWLWFAAPAAGFAAYLLIMRQTLGDPFAGLRSYSETFSYQPSIGRLFDLPHFAGEFLTVTGLHDHTGSLLDRVWFVAFLASLYPLWRKDRLYFLYALPVGLVPALSLSLVSFTRHFLLVFPVFILWGDWLAAEERRWLFWPLAASLHALQTVLLVMHVNNYWVG